MFNRNASAPPSYAASSVPPPAQRYVIIDGDDGQHAHFNLQQRKLEAFDAIVGDMDIEPTVRQEVREMLCGSKKVMVIDNSSSMRQSVKSDETHLKKLPRYAGTYENKIVRRWDELIEFIKIALPILALDSDQGVDFWFLNEPYQDGRKKWLGVQNWDEIKDVFAQNPRDSTPLVETLEDMQKYYSRNGTLKERGLHCIVTTDGEPNGKNGLTGAKRFAKFVADRPEKEKFIMNIQICTDNDDEVEYLEKVDTDIPRVDVNDDFHTEQEAVLKAGRIRTFGYDTYVLKCIIGAASLKLDQLDEKKSLRERLGSCWGFGKKNNSHWQD